ncbi:MAG: pyridoxal phosphate-dependent aminotransferase [Sphingomonadaceae bacterium]
MKGFAKGPVAMRHSGIREIMNLTAGVPDVIHMEVGQPDFPTPEHVVAAAAQAGRDGYTRYTPSAGFLSLRELVAAKLQRVNHFTVSPENINVTAGGVNAIALTLRALVEAGDEVLLPDPAWPNYEMMMSVIGCVPVRYPLDPSTGFLPDFAAMEKLVTSRTKVVLMNTPTNPTGTVFPKQVVQDMVRFVERHDLWLLSDEAYDEIVYEGEHFSAAPFNPERVASVYTLSKTYAMCGWRVGYVAAPRELSELINKLIEPDVSSASSISQKAAEAALAGPQDCVRAMCDSYRERRDMAMQILATHDLLISKPQGAFYILVDITRSGLDSYTFAERLAVEHKVAVAPGATFGPAGEKWVRVSLCTERSALTEGLRRLCEVLCDG